MTLGTGLQFTVTVGALSPDTFAVVKFELDEQLNLHLLDEHGQWAGPFQLAIELASYQANVDVEDVLDQPCELVVWFDGQVQRRISGVVSQFDEGDTGFRRTRYRVEVRPALWRLSLRRNCRIFQHQTPQEIISVLLQEMGIVDYAFALRHDHPTREYCVQYRESDYDFVTRLAAQEGMFVYHEYEQGTHRVIFADDATVLTDLPVILPYNTSPQTLNHGAAVQSFRYAESVRPSSVALKDYDFTRPRYSMLHQLASNELHHQRETYEHFDYPGRYQDDASGKAFTDCLLAGLRADATTGCGKSNCAALAPGRRFTLQDHPSGTLNRDWQLVTVHHEGHQPQALEEEGGSEPTTYHNEFTAIDAHLTWRNVPPPQPKIAGPQSARVVGPENEEIYCDEFGRIKVLFPWNRYGASDENVSCWLRVSQQWAGGQYGAMAIPRVGHEVLVSFFEGDPNRPLVTGTAYHATNRPPYSLPENKTRTVLHTQTHKGKGFNELRFEDQAGQEEIYLHGQKDLTVDILNDSDTHIKLDERTDIDNQRVTTIGANDHLTVEGEKRDHIKGDYSLQVDSDLHQKMGYSLLTEAGQEIHIKVGGKLVLEAGSEITAKAGGSFIKLGPSAVTLVGPTIKMNSGGKPGSGTPCAPVLPETNKAMAEEVAPQALEIEPIPALLDTPPAAPIPVMPAEEEEEEEETPLSVLRIGVFFDGTANNTYNAQQGLAQIEQWLNETCSDPAQRDKELQECKRSNLPAKDSAANDITNIGKAYALYKWGKHDECSAFLARVYVSGIGTRDPVAGEPRSDDTLTQGLDVDWLGEDTAIIGKVRTACETGITTGISDSLQEFIADLGIVGRIEFDVFGFSRGAAAARHFINEIDQRNDHPLVEAMANFKDVQLKDGFDWASREDVRIRFVGLFDTVVSSFNPAVNVHIKPDSVERVVHLTALDEVRANFPLTRVTDDAAGTTIPAHFTEIALPGAHSDVGGGYYSRWSLRNPNSDVVLTETVTASHFASVERGSIPDSHSHAYQRAMAYAREAIDQGWAAKLNPNLTKGATPPVNTISLMPYSFWRSTAPDALRSVYVDVIINRVVEGEYSRLPLHMMVEAGLAAGVPFMGWDPTDKSLKLDSRRTKAPLVDLVKLDQHWAQLATLEGAKGIAKLPLNVTSRIVGLPSQVHALLRQEYLHHSAAVGLVSHPSTVASEPTVSKARRKLIGNGSTTEESATEEVNE